MSSTDLSSLFQPDTNRVQIILKDDPYYAFYYGCSSLWLVGSDTTKKRISLTSANEYRRAPVDSIRKVNSYRFGLFPPVPNPFTKKALIRYGIGKPVYTKIGIYNIVGQLIRVLVDGNKEAGYYSIYWDGKDNEGRILPSGVYFYRLEAGSFKRTGKILKIK